jgi:hypothetical protein
MWSGWHTFSLGVIIVAIVLVGLLFPPDSRFWVWLSVVLLLVAFGVVAGHGITGLWHGLLVDERNKLSLSRLQMFLWTLVVLSGFVTAALSNLAADQVDPLAITIPSALWLLIGISTTSLVASPLIRSTKRARLADRDEVRDTFALLSNQGVDIGGIAAKGQIVVNTTLKDARWSDLFMGEETGNAGRLDLAKVQMFYFTLILVLAYGVALGAMFLSDMSRVTTFPNLGQGVVVLMGISHAGYLVSKAIPHSQSR